MKSRAKRPTWFKMFVRQKAIIDAVSDETAGKAIKACLTYFDTREICEMDSTTFAVFSAIKPDIDESFSDYQRSVDSGRAGADKRWGLDE